MWFYSGGVCVVLFGGACVVLFGGHAWFYLGGCMVLFGGHAWFYLGGPAWFYSGGMHGFSSFFGYNEIRSMSRRYASYWNAFLFCIRILTTSPPGPDTPPPQTRHTHPTPPDQSQNPPPGPDTHTPDQTHIPGPETPPSPGSRLRHTVYERPVRILLECILVCRYEYTIIG